MSIDAVAIPYSDIDDGELSVAQLQEKYEPICLGPTWQRTADGGWLLPEKTLGWEIVGWMAQYLRGPDGSEHMNLTLEQLRFLLWWYAVDSNGEFIARTGVLQRLKGWGKDPLAAAMCLAELCGPVRFSHFTAAGDPVGKPHPTPLVQIAAVNQEQTKNTTTMFAILMTDEFRSTYRIEAGKELIYANAGRGRLMAVTSSPRALEGARSTFVILNETHHWLDSNRGTSMYETIDGNVTKMDGRYLAITNAFLPGEDSVAERMRDNYDKILEGNAADIGFMYDSLEAPSHTPLDPRILPTILEMIRGDSVWLKIDAMLKSILSTTIAPSRSRRMYLNQIVSEEDALYSPAIWDVLRTDAELAAGDEVVLGFDGGKTDDSTALVAIRIKDRCVFLLDLWEQPDGPLGENWEIDKELVDGAVREAFRLYNVRGMYADIALWESYISDWEADFGDALGVKATERSTIGYDMRANQKVLTLAHERLMSTVFAGKIRHNGDRRLRRHVLNAKRRPNNYGISFGKESRESKRKVDAYAAAFLAFTCLHDLNSRGRKVAKKRTGRGYFL